MKTALCSQSGFARRIDRYLNSVWYPICLGALCAFSGLGNSSRYTVCMGLIAVTVLLTVLFATDMKPLFAPMLMSFCALGRDTGDTYWEVSGDVMRYYRDGAFAFVIFLGVIAVGALLIRFWKDGTLKDIWENRGSCFWSILMMDIAFLLNGIFSVHWVALDLAYGALMAFGFTFFYLVCASVARRGENIVRFACQCMVCAAFIGVVQVAAVLLKSGDISVEMGILSTQSRGHIELGWGLSTTITAFVVLGIPAAFYLAANHRFAPVSYGLGLFLFAFVVFVGSRSALLAGGLATAVCAVACCFGKNKRACRRLSIGLLILMGMALILCHFFLRPLSQIALSLAGKLRLNALGEDSRVMIWKQGWEAFHSAPLFGVGFDRGAVIPHEMVQNFFGRMYHSLFIQFMGAMGIAGLLAFLFHLWQVGSLFRKPTAKKILILTLPLMILLMSLVDNFFFYLNQQIAYCMFIAVAERKEI